MATGSTVDVAAIALTTSISQLEVIALYQLLGCCPFPGKKERLSTGEVNCQS